MKHALLKSICVLVVSAVVAHLVTGCASTPRAKPRTVIFHKTGDPRETIAVDVVLVSPGDIAYWRGLAITNYFDKPTNPWRQRAKENRMTIELPWRNGSIIALDRHDERWEEWIRRGAQYMVILADLPRKDLGQSEAWRNVIDLSDRASKGRTIVVEVSPAMVSVRAEKQ